MKKVKILSLTTVYPTPDEPGSGIFIRTRLQHMAAGAEIRIVAPKAVVRLWRSLQFRQRKKPVEGPDEGLDVIRPGWVYPPFAGAWNAIFLFLQVVIPIKCLRSRFPFEIIDSHFGHPEGVAAALLARVFRCPFVITLRGSEQLHGKHRLRRLSMGWALRRASRVIAVSERLRKFAIELGVPSGRAVTVPNGIDTRVFYPGDRAADRAAYGIGPGQQLIVSAGHLIELKGHHRIILAVRGLLDRGNDVILVIAGGRGRAEDYEPILRSEIAALGVVDRVRLVGHLPPSELARLIGAADVFCLASAREGWPNVVHEALACGTPVVAADVGAVPEMIPSDQYGIVVRADEVPALENGLREALSRPWDRAAIAAWGQLRSWGQVASEVLKQIEDVLAEHARDAALLIRPPSPPA